MYASKLMELARKNQQEYEGKRYKCLLCKFADGLGGLHDEIIVKDGKFYFADGGSGYSVFVSYDTQLEEIPQSVPFMEARKAHEEGKVVIAKFPDFNSGRMLTVRYWKDSDGSDKCDLGGCELSFYIIRTAEWYIVEKEGSK